MAYADQQRSETNYSLDIIIGYVKKFRLCSNEDISLFRNCINQENMESKNSDPHLKVQCKNYHGQNCKNKKVLKDIIEKYPIIVNTTGEHFDLLSFLLIIGENFDLSDLLEEFTLTSLNVLLVEEYYK